MAHELARDRLTEAGYAHARGVAQQAARLVRAVRPARDARAILLSAAWLCGTDTPRCLARRLRLAGCERLARVVAHRGFGEMQAVLRGDTLVSAEFPIPAGVDEDMLRLLDIAWVTTDAAGARSTPGAQLRALTARVGAGDPEVRATVAMLTRLGDDPATRALTELVSRPRPPA